MTILDEHIELPALVAFNGSENSYQPIRPLTKEEQTELANARILYGIIKPIMTMFGVADLNHKDVTQFSEALLSRKNRPHNTMLVANRVIFNYVAAANALMAHTQKNFDLLFRAKKTENNIFRDFCEKMKHDSDDFQFFCEFRNHVLHNTLPVGRMNETISASDGIGISLSYSSESLLRSGRGWASCRLLKKQSTIDLKRQIEAFHAILNKDVLKVIIGTLAGPLKESNAIYHRLAEEACAANPNHRAVILTERTLNGADFEFTVAVIPGDIFQDLGVMLNVVRPGEAE